MRKGSNSCRHYIFTCGSNVSRLTDIFAGHQGVVPEAVILVRKASPESLPPMESPNHHTIVRSSDREIRLLYLLPGREEDSIRCTTRVVSLDQHPDFETVSYVWGDRKEERDIEVSGKTIRITTNLYTGLLRLRYTKIERTLWIDQICINQWDLEEKAAQVAIMRDIYKQCTQCVTWMGELTRDGHEVPVRDAEAVFEFLRQVAAAKITPLSSLPILFEQSEEGSAARRAFEHFSMYGNPWWSRIWTVQEAIIPTSGILVWGPLAISRKDVLAAARNLRDLPNLPYLPEGFALYRHTYTELLRRLLYPVHGFNHSKTDNALNLLMRWRHREFTDPRDKVYALLGMIKPDAIPNAQSCDYTIAVCRLFAQVTLDLIRHEGGLRPLLGACEMPQQSLDIPSWAIDFACVNRIGKRQLRWWGHSHRYKVFSACGENGLELSDTPDVQVLGLRGVNVDEVVSTVELLRVSAQDPIDLLELSEPLANCVQLLKQFRASEEVSAVYKDGFTWDSAFCRTLVGDLIMDELPLDGIATYGRARLEADFEELFDKLQIRLDTKLDLDFAAVFDPYLPAYSPTFPTHPLIPPAYSPTSSARSPTSPAYLPTSPVFSEHSMTAEHDQVAGTANILGESPGSAAEVLADLKNSNRSYSPESDDDSESQYSYGSERPVRRKRPVIRFDDVKDMSPFGRQDKKVVTTANEGDLTEAVNMSLNMSNAQIGVPGSPRKSDASYVSNLSGYSETHWITLPTKINPYLGTEEDECRQSRIRRLRAEFITTEATMSSNQHLTKREPDVFTNLHESLIGMMENQTFFITKSGYIGIGPPQTTTGDQVWVFNGGDVPFVMRKVMDEEGDCPQLALIGDAYVHGVMDGEAIINELLVQSVNVY